jgi:serine/threonine-protein kinase
MADEPRVQRMLDEILDSDRTPEEVCGDCPELLPEVRKRWQKVGDLLKRAQEGK